MQPPDYPSRNDNYDQLVNHLLNSQSPLNYTLDYLLENYGDRAVPALLQALPARPWQERRIILEVLGKLGDIRAIVPICALLYSEQNSSTQMENVISASLKNLVRYSAKNKKAVEILVHTIVRYKGCTNAVADVLKQQSDKFTIKLAYKKLFRNERYDLKEAAIDIIGTENALINYRIKYLKKILLKLDDQILKHQVIEALKILISRKRCMNLCRKKGLKFDAFFQRPENNNYDCCCVDKGGKRTLIQFEGALFPGKSNTALPVTVKSDANTSRKSTSDSTH